MPNTLFDCRLVVGTFINETLTIVQSFKFFLFFRLNIEVSTLLAYEFEMHFDDRIQKVKK